MLNTILQVIYGLICLALLVFVHELGHLIAAKISGIKVTGFSIGFGPILFHKSFKGTDYRISAIPLGGYCEMKGEKDFQKAVEEKLNTIPAESDSFYGVHPLKRAFVAFAGPFSNIIFACIAFTVISMVGFSYYTTSSRIYLPDESVYSPAREAGLLNGDIITKINDIKIENFSDLQETVAVRPNEELEVVVDRDGTLLSFKIKTSINKEQGNGILGVQNDPSSLIKVDAKTYSFFPAILNGIKETYKMTALTLKSLKILFMGIDVTNAVSGPARITTMIGETVQMGFGIGFKTGLVSVLQFLSLISVSLFIMNLLPVPVLDGGIILFALIECIMRKPVPPKYQIKIQYAGIALILCLLILGTTGDVKYFINKYKANKTAVEEPAQNIYQEDSNRQDFKE